MQATNLESVPKLEPFQAVAVAAFELLPKSMMDEIFEHARTLVAPTALHHDWNGMLFTLAIFNELSTLQRMNAREPQTNP